MKASRVGWFCVLAVAAASVAAGDMTYHAKIVTEDGTPLPSIPLIRVGLAGRLIPACQIDNVFGNGNVVYSPDLESRFFDPRSADDCPVTIRLSGYRVTEAVLRDGATIVLKRVGDHEGSTVAISSLKAPEAARKAYEKGVAAMNAGKVRTAQKNFERAVEIYPEYAQAWSDLGDIYQKQSMAKEAREAFERGSNADPKYIRPYVQLARLALGESRMADALEITTRALALRQTDVAAIYYYHAVASYNLKQYDAAEQAARHALDADTDHEIPRAEYLLGLALAAKGDRDRAVQHLQKYAFDNPLAQDAPEAQDVADKLLAANNNSDKP